MYSTLTDRRCISGSTSSPRINRPSRRRLAKAVAGVLALTGVGVSTNALATTFNAIWDPLETPTSPHDGSGTWDYSTTSNWDYPVNTTDYTWSGYGTSGVANIGDNNGAAGNINLVSVVNVVGINFNKPGSGNYTLTSNNGDYIYFNTSALTITTATGVNPTLGLQLVGTQPLVIAGPGNLNITGANTLVATNITTGTLSVGSYSALGTGPVTVSAAGSVYVNLPAAFAGGVTNSGIFNVSTPSAVTTGSFSQNSGTLNVQGTLYASSFFYGGGVINGQVSVGSSIQFAGGNGGNFLLAQGGTTMIESTYIPSLSIVTLAPSSGSGTLVSDESSLENDGNLTLTSPNGGSVGLSNSGFINDGTVTVNAIGVASAAAYIPPTTNVGTFNANASVSANGTFTNTGITNVAAAAVVTIPSSYQFIQAGGALNININGTLALNTFNYSGGTVNGTVLFNNTSGSSTLYLGTNISTGSFLFTGGGYAYVNTNASSGIPAGINVTVHPSSNSSSAVLYSSSNLINNGTLALISSSGEYVNLQTSSLFTNNGQFSITPGGAQYSSGDQLNSVVLNNAPGVFSLNANTSTGYNVNNLGTFNIAAGQALTMSNSPTTFNQAGGVLNINGTLTVSTFNYSGGTVNGTVLFNNSSATNTLNLGMNTSTGSFLFTAGGYAYVNTNASSGIPAGINVTVHPSSNSSSAVLYSSSNLINNGTLALISSSGEYVNLQTSSLFTNNGQFSITPGGAQYSSGDQLNSVVLNNAPGVFSLNANTSTGYNVNNLGTFNIAAGQALTMSNSPTTFNQAGGVLNINGTLTVSTFNYSGGTVNGTVLFNNSSATNTLNLGMNTSTGSFLFTAGGYAYVNTNASSGIPAGINVTVHPSSNSSSAVLYSSSNLINNGTLALISSSGEYVNLQTSSLFTNNGQFSITPGGAQYSSGDQLNSVVLNNAPGVFSLNANTSTGYNVNNLGTFNIAAGQALTMSNSPTTFNQAGGVLNINGTLTVSTFNYSGGTVNGTVLFNNSSATNTLNLGMNTSTGSFLFTAGGYAYVNTNASSGIPAGINVTVHPSSNSSSAVLFSSSNLINNGTLALISSSGEYVNLQTSSLFTNNGQFSITPGGAQYSSGDQLNSVVLNNAPGVFSLNANTSTGYNVNNLGTFNIAVGQNLGFTSSSVGFNESGGTLNVPGNYYVGGNPTGANGDGFLNVSGGSVVVNGTLKIWNSSTALTLNGGSVTTGILDTNGNPANLHWTGGSLTINESNPIIDSITTSTFGAVFNISSAMTFTVAGGNNELVGINNTGTVNQTGGIHIVTGSLNLGVSASGYQLNTGTGNYALSGTGQLSSTTETVGMAGNGYFNQSGGTNAVSNLVIGSQSTGYGNYQLYTGGNLTVTGALLVGQSGAGVFTQSAGASNIQEMDLGTQPGGSGVAYFTGGSASVQGNANIGGVGSSAGGSGVLDVFNGGSLAVAGTTTVFDSQANLIDLSNGGTMSTNALIVLGGSSTIASGSTLTVASGGLIFGSNDSPSLNTANGSLVLHGDVLFNGSGGTASIYSSGSGTIDLGGGNRTFNVFASSATISMSVASNLIDGALIKTGPGTLLISGTNSYAGSTTVSAGTLELGSSLAVNGSSGILVSNGATLDLGGQAIGATPLTLNGTGVAAAGSLINSSTSPASFAGPITMASNVAVSGFGPMTLNGLISGAGSLSKIGFNTVALAGGGNFSGGLVVNSGTLAITSATSFTGGISLVGGTLAIQTDSDLGDPSNQIVLSAGGTLEALAGTHAISSARTVTAVGGTVQVDATQTLTLTGTILGAGPLNKTGAGILRLTSPSGITGSINISAGTLSLAGTGGALPSVGGITVATTGILELNSMDSLGGNQTSQDRVYDLAPITLAGGTLSMQGSSSALTTELLGQLILQPGASTIAVTAGTAQSAYISFTSMGARSFGGTLGFNAPDLGNSERVYFNSGYTDGQHLGGWATVNGTDFAKYSASLGVVPFTSSDYSYNTFAAGPDVQLNSNWSGTVPTVAISTLNLNSTSGLLVTQTPGSTLTLTSGGLLKQGLGNANITGGTITSTSGELDISVNPINTSLEISSTLIGSFVLTERGAGTLILDGPGTNNYSGFTLVSGNLQLNSSGTAIHGAFVLDGGTLLSLASGQFDPGSTVVINSGSWNLNHKSENITSFTNNNGFMQFSGGTLNVSGGVFLNGGTTLVASTLNSNQLTVSGGSNTVASGGLVTEGSLTFLSSNPAVQVGSDNAVPGKVILTGSGLLAFAGTGTASLVSTGNGNLAGILDLNGSNAHVVTVASGATLMISTQITNGGFNFDGPGTLDLSGASNYSGGTIITGTGSTLIAENTAALGANGPTGATVTFAGGTLALRSDSALAAYSIAGGVANPGTTVNIDIDLRTLTNTSAGTFSVNTLTVGSGSAGFNVTGNDGGTLLVGSGGLGMTILSNGGPAVFNTAANLTINGPLIDSGALVGLAKLGLGTLTFTGTGSNSFGATNVSGGTVLLNKSSGLAIPSDLIINNGSVVRLMQSNQIISTSAITINGAGGASLLDLNGNNNLFSGGITFLAGGGKLSTGTGAAVLASDVSFIANQSSTAAAVITGNLNLSGGVRTFNIQSGGGLVDMEIDAAISGTGTGLTKAGAGTLYLTGANTFTGPIQVNGGVLEVNSAANLGSTANIVTLDGGTLQFFTAFDPSANGISLPAASSLDTLANIVPISGAINGAGSLTKLGTGLLALKGANGFSGGLAIDAGTVQVSSDANLGAAGMPVTIAGGTLNVTASINSSRLFTVNISGGSLNAGTGTVTLSNAANFSSNLSLTAGTLFLNESTGTPVVNGSPTITVMPTAALIDGGPLDALKGVNSGSVVTLVNNSIAGFNVANGSKSVGSITGSGNTNISSGTTLTTSYIRQGGLSENGNLNITPQPGVRNSSSTVSVIGTLTTAGTTNAWTGKIDLANNDLIVQNTSLGTLTNQIQEGYAAGAWNGTGGIISSSAASNASHLTTLGILQNNQGGTALYGTGAATPLFDGQSPNPTDILVAYTYYGDTNLDGKIDGSDYSRIDFSYLHGGTGWFNGDFNYDGVINGSDYTLIDNAFNSQGSILASEIGNPSATITAQVGGVSGVPEPAAIGFSLIAAVGMLGRRSRRVSV